MSGVRIIIVDDDPGIRSILKVLAEDAGAEVMAEAHNGRDAIEKADQYHPEIMLLDVSMPIMGGFPAARHLRRHLPELRIILVSQHSQKAYAEEALEIGAKGYILKGSVATELGPAMKIIAGGGTFISPGINLSYVSQEARVSGGK
jgi:DNA-binding NarL/FixJ family response regulator